MLPSPLIYFFTIVFVSFSTTQYTTEKLSLIHIFRALGVWADFLAALGASPTNIAGTEVYQALQLGTIDGALYGWSSLSDSNNIREVAQYALSPLSLIHI